MASTIYRKKIVNFRMNKLLIPLCFIFFYNSAEAQQIPKVIGKNQNWTSLTYNERGKKVCYISPSRKNSPKKWTSNKKSVRRGKIYVLVTHRPASDTRDEVSIYVGYPLKKDSDVIVEIDGRRFRMFTDSNTAWARDTKTDKAIVQSMRSGRNLIVRGVSARGTKTIDTYDLNGFTAVHNDINKACR